MPGSARRELRRRQRCRGKRERHDRQVGVVVLPDDRLFQLRRQIGANARDRIADVLRRFRQRLRELELDHDAAEPVLRLPPHLLHTGDGRIASSTGSRTSRSTPSGEAPG